MDLKKSVLPQNGAGAKPANSRTFIPFKAISFEFFQQSYYYHISLMMIC